MAMQASLLPMLESSGRVRAVMQDQEQSRADQQRMAFVLSLREQGLADVALLRAMETIPREIFVPHHFADLAWRDIALPIACGQTMPQPFAVARMVAALELEPHHRVLEIGAGSGYATAILSRLAGEVRSCERFRSLAHAAQSRLEALAIHNANVRWADGFDIPSDSGVFDRIVVDTAITDVPRALSALLAPGGLMLFARATSVHSLRRTPSGFAEDLVFAARYAPAIPGRSAEL